MCVIGMVAPFVLPKSTFSDLMKVKSGTVLVRMAQESEPWPKNDKRGVRKRV